MSGTCVNVKGSSYCYGLTSRQEVIWNYFRATWPDLAPVSPNWVGVDSHAGLDAMEFEHSGGEPHPTTYAAFKAIIAGNPFTLPCGIAINYPVREDDYWVEYEPGKHEHVFPVKHGLYVDLWRNRKQTLGFVRLGKVYRNAVYVRDLVAPLTKEIDADIRKRYKATELTKPDDYRPDPEPPSTKDTNLTGLFIGGLIGYAFGELSGNKASALLYGAAGAAAGWLIDRVEDIVP